MIIFYETLVLYAVLKVDSRERRMEGGTELKGFHDMVQEVVETRQGRGRLSGDLSPSTGLLEHYMHVMYMTGKALYIK